MAFSFPLRVPSTSVGSKDLLGWVSYSVTLGRKSVTPNVRRRLCSILL